MSYWVEDRDGDYVGDLATNRGIAELRGRSAALDRFLDTGTADETTVSEIVQQTRGREGLDYVADLLEGERAPLFITDGCGDADDA